MNPNNTPVNTAQFQPSKPKRRRFTLKTWVIVSNVAFLVSAGLTSYMSWVFQDMGIFAFALLIEVFNSAWLPILVVPTIYIAGIAGGVAGVVLNTIYFPGRMNTSVSKTLIRILWVIVNAVLYLCLWVVPVIFLAG